MFTLNALHAAAVIGAVALLLLLQPRSGRRGLRAAGALLGLGAVGVFLSEGLRRMVPEQFDTILPLCFGGLAVIAAVRLITLSQPVLAALHFVVVVLASAAMFLLLEAEFMAFALIIVYAGAILITYLFVLMLARQSPTDAAAGGGADYDAIPREPLAAVAVGMVLLAGVSSAMIADLAERTPEDAAAAASRSMSVAFEELERMPRLLDRMAKERFPGSLGVVADADGRRLSIGVGSASAMVAWPEGAPPTRWTLGEDDLPGNTRLVGMALVAAYPASLELAGVVLLMAMFGAVVLARRQIELGEDERREAAGLGRLSVDEPEGAA